MELDLLPKFNEKDPDVFFPLFELGLQGQESGLTEQMLLLQCVLSGKAQEAYVALGDDLTYISVKDAVLKAYELVPEAYRQRFRTWEKKDQPVSSMRVVNISCKVHFSFYMLFADFYSSMSFLYIHPLPCSF